MPPLCSIFISLTHDYRDNFRILLQSQEVKPSTLWSKYSMIKAVLSVKENIEINKFSRVIAFLKRNSVGYEPTKSKVLTRQEIDTFLTNADDMKYLLIKVSLKIILCIR